MNAKSFVGGLLAGAAIGVAIGILLAPESGFKTRAKLKKGVRELGENLMETAEGTIHAFKGKFNSGVDELAANGMEGVNHLIERAKT